MKIAIKAENLSKAYQLGEIGTGTISRDLERWYARVRGKEDPFLQIGEANDRAIKGTSDVVWSLKDINFEIEQGDAVGIIGRNGAGKSTLLKVLSRVTSPTTGRITGNGRIASLLEVGTGFHPELTGRENIYLNGAILGMRKKEINRKFDEIVDFAGVERYIDTPVKRYSSGMYVRLAFAVAAHLESEILIVDEVLAVGDAEFQKKCLGKMGDVSKGEGRTVLFVSHNMASVVQLCTKGVLLNQGRMEFMGDARDAITQYSNIEKSISMNYINENSIDFNIARVTLMSKNINSNRLGFSDEIIFEIIVNDNINFSGVHLGVALIDKWKRKLFTTTTILTKKNSYTLTMPQKLLLSGTYTLDVATFVPNANTYQYLKDICPFEIEDFESESSIYGNSEIGIINVNCLWSN